jgi:hypothetical protein
LLFVSASKEHAQNGRGIKRATQRTDVFLYCVVARIRALCAITELAANALHGSWRFPDRFMPSTAWLPASKEISPFRHIKIRPSGVM